MTIGGAPPAEDLAAPPTVLCVDDEPHILSALRRLFRPTGIRLLTADSGTQALQMLGHESVDAVISDMRMPGMSGAELLEHVCAGWPDTMRLLLTGYADMQSTVAAINQGRIFRYVSKPWQDNELLQALEQALEHRRLTRERNRLLALTARQNADLLALNQSLEQKVQARTEDVRRAFTTSISVLTNLIELRDGAMAGHSRRVAVLARQIAQRMGLPNDTVQDIMLAGLLHDIGKIGMPDSVRNRPSGDLSAEERAMLRQHPVLGERALIALEGIGCATGMIRSHHERFDGGGFPDGLAGEDIPLGARIVAVADEFDALQGGGRIGTKVTPADALSLIRREGSGQFDPAVVAAFADLREEALRSRPRLAEKSVAFGDLQPDMRLARDLLDRDGILLLAAGQVLTAPVLAKLTRLRGEELSRSVVHVVTTAAPLSPPGPPRSPRAP